MYDEELTPERNTARALCSIAESLRGIGLGGTTPGALEFIGMQLREMNLRQARDLGEDADPPPGPAEDDLDDETRAYLNWERSRGCT